MKINKFLLSLYLLAVLAVSLAVPYGSAKAAATVAFSCSGAFLYTNTSDIANASGLYTLNFSNTSLSKASFGTASGAVNAMGYRTQDNFVYAIGVGAGNHNHLFKFDSVGGESDLGAVTGLDTDKDLVAGAFGSDGFLYAFTGDTDTTMYKINVTDQTSSTVTLGAHTSINDIGFNVNDGKFYGYDAGATGDTNDGRLVSITTTGTVTQIGSISNYSYHDMGSAWVFGDQFYGLENRTGELRQFTLTGGSAGTVVGTTFTLSPPDGEPGSSAQHDGASCATASFTPPTPTPTPSLPDTSSKTVPINTRPYAFVLLSIALVGLTSTGIGIAKLQKSKASSPKKSKK